MSLKDLLQNDVKVNHVKIKVLGIHSENIIVGDKSMIAICSAENSSYKELAEGKCYMILKPIKRDNINLIPNEKLKPLLLLNLPCKLNNNFKFRK